MNANDKTPAGVQAIETIELTLRNHPGSLLVVHAFSHKAKEQIRAKQAKRATAKKAARDPEQEFKDAKLVDEQGRECVPVTALKKAIVNAATAFDDLKKVALRQALFVDSVASPGSPLVPIENYDGTNAIGSMREDAVTIGTNTRGLTYRPQYANWQVRIHIEFNTRLVSEQQLRALVTQAGWGVGICEGRPERTSALGWGRFVIVEKVAE